MGEQALKSHANGKIHKKFVCVREIHMYFDKMSVRKVYFSGCLSGENTRILINVREIFDKFWLRTLRGFLRTFLYALCNYTKQTEVLGTNWA
jgi:hypothetical protein